MCGIFANISKISNNPEQLKRLGNKCNHRGPDSTKELYIHNENYHIYFLFHRLAINGLNPESDQPLNIKTFPNYILICNGEIYNYKELERDNNFTLETDSDCEIIIHMYSKYTVSDFIDKLDGVFSFILYDSILNKIIIGHDPFGIRPLYYSYKNDNIYFSSEMKCISENNNDVKFYPPGSFSEINLNDFSMDTKRFYHFDYKQFDQDEKLIINTIKSKLINSVKKRLITDRPFGCLLSGGLDSSIIVSIICNLYRQCGKANVRTFSIGLEGSPDLLAAQKVANYLGTEHTSVTVSKEEMLEAIDSTIYQIESKDITTIRASVPMFLISKYIRDNTDIKVIFSGEGSDEASGSYLYFHNAPSPEDFQEECIRLLKDVRMFDVLRSDKTTAGAGLEIRVPFFDKEFMDFYMGIKPEKKIVRDGYEKYLLRKAFEDDLPQEISWRRKDGFSDGVSCNEKPWYEIINEYANEYFKMNEEELYLDIYKKYYPNKENIIPYNWMPKWTDTNNPSGRLIIDS
jgi:asparagine synthase (glutamine-hydrolysing)